MSTSSTPLFRQSLLDAKRKLAEGREKIKRQHEAGSPGIQVCACLTDLLDSIVLDLYQHALADLQPEAGGVELTSRIALVAHGGYGRRDVAPYSDVDLMVLFQPGSEELIEPLAKRLMRDLYDAGFDLGQSVRTPDDACVLAMKDATIFTSLAESRLLTGNATLFGTLTEKLKRKAQSKSKAIFAAIEQSRRQERAQYGETVYLLEPNVKRTRGGLRDIQLLRWVGYARYGTADPDALQLRGVLSKEDQSTVRRAVEFLLRLRNEMHFQARKAQDVLGRTEQVRLAKLYGFADTEGLLAVEQFMRLYFSHTHAVRSVVSNFIAAARPGRTVDRVFGALFSRQVEGDYRVTPHTIVATRKGLAKLQSDPGEVLRLCDLANAYDKRIAQATWETTRIAAKTFQDEVSPETARRFLSLMSQPMRLAELLRRLHDLGVLEKIIPSFTHARGLLQFNEYHKYTVDEHSLLAVQRGTEFMTDTGPLGHIYRGIKQKRTLHLALLIHDLGKGHVEDHSELGLRIADDTARRLRMPLREAETLKFLVHKHLLMSHLAFRRDTSDDELVVRFAVEVGSPEVLDMLLVLTAADFSAVGPGVWNNWKAEVLTNLHHRAMRHLAGEATAADTQERLLALRDRVRAALTDRDDPAWFNKQLAALPAAYLYGAPPEKIAAELENLHELPQGEVQASGTFLEESHAVEFVIGTHEQITPGVFHKLTGALTSQGLQILSAEINTLADGLVLDRFYVSDPDYADAPPPYRLDEVKAAIVASLRSPQGDSPAFRKVWCSDQRRNGAALTKLPARVRVDNSTSDRFTILDIFASDRMGLLYTIARTLFQLELSVSTAKIGTYLDQVVDVFYVTDQQGQKVADEQRLQEISSRLLEAIEKLEKGEG